MATYLPNLSDNIAPVQVFNPNWQFFEASLQQLNAKQQQVVNSLENSYYVAAEADLTHEDNKRLRDEWLKTYKDTIQTLANIDLTKQENISYAKSLFNPILENRSFLDDYIKTKEIKTQLSYANENSPLYNETSKKALQYQLYQYSKSDYNSRLNLSPFKYIPYVSEDKLVLDYMQKLNPEVKTVSKTKDGKYNITYTNGANAVIPFTNIAASVLMSDPRIKETYKQESYVNRMELLYSQGAERGLEEYGNMINTLKETHNKYIDILENKVKEQKGTIEEYNNILYDKINEAQSLKKMGVLNKQIIDDINTLNERKKVLEQNMQHSLDIINNAKQTNNILNKQDILLSSSFDDLYASTKLMSTAMQLGLEYANATSKTDIKEDQFALKNLEHQYRMDEIRLRGALDKEIEKMKLHADLITPSQIVYNPNNKINIPTNTNTLNTAISSRNTNNQQLQSIYNKLKEYKLIDNEDNAAIIKTSNPEVANKFNSLSSELIAKENVDSKIPPVMQPLYNSKSAERYIITYQYNPNSGNFDVYAKVFAREANPINQYTTLGDGLNTSATVVDANVKSHEFRKKEMTPEEFNDYIDMLAVIKNENNY